jgi:hypothetical protein
LVRPFEEKSSFACSLSIVSSAINVFVHLHSPESHEVFPKSLAFVGELQFVSGINLSSSVYIKDDYDEPTDEVEQERVNDSHSRYRY